MKLTVPPSAPSWMFDVFRKIEQAFGIAEAPFKLKSYTVATLPAATAWPSGLIIVSDEVGGEVPAWSDGTNWRRVTDRTIVS